MKFYIIVFIILKLIGLGVVSAQNASTASDTNQTLTPLGSARPENNLQLVIGVFFNWEQLTKL